MPTPETETIDLLDLLALSVDRRFGRIADAVERTQAAAVRSAKAAERSADALETIAALFASCVGVGRAHCYGESSTTTTFGVPFLRTGSGSKPFTCDGTPGEEDDDH